MTRTERLIAIFEAKAKELGMTINIQKIGSKYFLEGTADDCRINVILGSRSGVHYVSHYDPVWGSDSYELKTASWWHVNFFFNSVSRQRKRAINGEAA